MFFDPTNFNSSLPIKKSCKVPIFAEYLAAIEKKNLGKLKELLQKSEIIELELSNDLEGLRRALDNWSGDSIEDESIVVLIITTLYPNNHDSYKAAKELMSCQHTFCYGQGDYHNNLDEVLLAAAKRAAATATSRPSPQVI
jgi:hypothetical protein